MIVPSEAPPPIPKDVTFQSEMRFTVQIRPGDVSATVFRVDTEPGKRIRTLEYGFECDDPEQYLVMLGQSVMKAYSDIVDEVFVQLGIAGPDEPPLSGFPR